MHDAILLPDGWKLVPLGDLLKFQNGFNTEKSAYGRGLPFANVLEVITHSHLTAAMIQGRVATTPAETSRYLVRRGDILFNRTSETQEEVGLASVYLGDEPILFGGFVLRGKPISVSLVPEFAGYGLRSGHVRRQIVATGQGGIRANIGQQSLSAIKLPLPPLPEQQAIAAALSDADGVVAGLERVIAKKRLIKQGAMQDLLTARRRLPGFSGEWEVKRLGDVARVATGGRNNQDKDPMGEYPFFVRSDTVERIRSFSYDCEAILVPGEGRIGEIFHYINGRFDVHQRVYCISAFSEETSGRFIYFVLRQFFGAHAMINTVKATVDSLRRPTFTGFEFRCPPSFSEQQAIAAVLSDMDAEIQALESRLTKARAVKEGMMQNLLTGRVRLV